jgi:sodium transport system permease protein
MLHAVKIVLLKELVDALRDRKALMTILISPVLTLALIYGGIHFVVFLQQDSQEITLAVSGKDNAQPLMAWLNERGIETKPAADDAIDAVRKHQSELLLIIPDDFPDQIANFKIAEVELVYDQSRKDIAGKVVNVKIALQQWSNNIGALRLIARGVSPQVMSPMQVVDTDVSEQRGGAAFLFGMVAMIITIMVFSSSVGVSVDMMAGEREKHSLEPLLLSPVSRVSLLVGKWLTAAVVTLAVIILINAALYFLIPQLPLDQLGLRTELRLLDIIYLTLIALPLILLSTIFQLFVSIFSKSFKEAQSYIALLLIIPILVGYYVIWSDVSQPWQYWVPVMGSQNLMEDILSKGYSEGVNYFACLAVTLGLSCLLAYATARQLTREKIIYG